MAQLPTVSWPPISIVNPNGYGITETMTVYASGEVFVRFVGNSTSTQGSVIQQRYVYDPSVSAYIGTYTYVTTETNFVDDAELMVSPQNFVMVDDQPYMVADAVEEASAKKKSLALLLSLLDKKQRKQLQDHGSFDVIGQDGLKYNIYASKTYNIIVRDRRGKTVRYCAAPELRLPVYDVMLAQKLMIETNLKQFKRIANKHVVE